MMKRLEAKYAALQIVPVISKLGTSKVKKGLLDEKIQWFSLLRCRLTSSWARMICPIAW